MPRPDLRADDGLSLVEVLVVILIIGILAAVGVPTLLGQRTKAQDANAKANASTAAKAATAYGTGKGSFDDLTRDELIKVEQSLASVRNLQVDGDGRTFTVSVESHAGTAYSITRAADGQLTRDCAPAGHGSCRDSVDERGHRW